MGVVVGFAGPDGLLVELDAFVRGAAEDHGAHAAIADRQGVGPQIGGLAYQRVRGDGWATAAAPAARMASATTVSFS